MRTLLLSLLGTVCLVMSAQAQTQRQTRPDLMRLPALDKNLFAPGIHVDMTLSEVTGIAASARWTLLEESDGMIRYETEPVRLQPSASPLSRIHTISLGNGKVRAVSTTIRGSIGDEKRVAMFYDVVGAMMENRAEALKSDNNRRIMTHTLADGRTMRVIWNQVSPTHAEVEAAVDVVDDALHPLR